MSAKIIIGTLGILLISYFSSKANAEDKIVIVISKSEINYEPDFLDSINNMPFFDLQDTILHFCFKHINFTSKQNNFYTIEIKKRSFNQSKIQPLLSKKIDRIAIKNDSYCDIIPISEGILSSGNYDLIISSLNDSNFITTQSKQSFQILRAKTVFQPKVPVINEKSFSMEEVDISKTFVAKYNLELIKKNIATLSPIAKNGEVKVVKEIELANDTQNLKRFFYYFWQSRNSENPEAEWKTYAEKLNHVAKAFGTSNQAGYTTDRGRIFLAYGEPDDVVRVINEKDALPYEIWTYHYLGGVSNERFLFYQPGLLRNEMFLIHSTVEGEIQTPQWKMFILTDPNNNDNKLMHRVFEYFN